MPYYSVYTTTKDEGEAKEIGKALVEEKLAACINIHPIKSIFWWEEEIVEENEAAMFVKTKVELVDEVIKRVKELHSYEVPCIVSLPIEKGHRDFLKWIGQSTK